MAELNKPSSVLCAAVTFLLLSACDTPATRNPVPVTQLGLNIDSRSGATTVRKGDTVSAIAQRYRLNMRDIIDANKLSAPFHLTENQRLLLPPPNEHKVGRNDTLLRLSRMYDVSITEMVRLNNLSEPYSLQAGQVLRLPSRMSDPPVSDERDTVMAEAVRPPSAPAAATPARGKAPAATPTAPTRPLLDKSMNNLSLKPLNGVRGDFAWPVRGRTISKYGPKTGGLFNDGINIAAARGTAVNAAASGNVVYVGNDLRSYGNIVLVRHPGGFVTAYSHLGETMVKRGDLVTKGQKIATVGTSGTVAEPQLHFEIRKGSQTYDPVRFLGD